MVSIKKTIYYLLDHKTKEIFLYDNFIKAREKREEFMEKYGPKTFTLSNGNVIEDCYPIDINQKNLKHYYGTVFMLYKFKKNGVFAAYIEGRKKEIDQIQKYANLEGFTLQKFVIVPYKEFKKQFEPDDDESTDLDSLPPVSLF